MDLSDYFPIWNKLTIQEREVLQNSAGKRFAQKGTILHNGSADCVGLLLVQTGQLRAYILSDEGKEVTLYRLFPGDVCLFSASCIMTNIQFELIIEAEKDSDMWVIPAEIYHNLMENSASLANYTNEIMAARFSEVMWLIEQIMWKSLDKRLAAFLVEEAELEGISSLRITHEKIANHLGSAREVVTRMLRYFQGEGLVALTRGNIEILDKKALQSLL